MLVLCTEQEQVADIAHNVMVLFQKENENSALFWNLKCSIGLKININHLIHLPFRLLDQKRVNMKSPSDSYIKEFITLWLHTMTIGLSLHTCMGNVGVGLPQKF